MLDCRTRSDLFCLTSHCYHFHHHLTTITNHYSHQSLHILITTLTNLTDGVFSNEQEEKDIISELKVLMHVEAHPNIVCLLGASVNNGRKHICNYRIVSG